MEWICTRHWWNSKNKSRFGGVRPSEISSGWKQGLKQSAKSFRTRWQGDSFWISSCLISMLNFWGVYYMCFCFFPLERNSRFQVKPDKAAPEMNKIYRSFSIGWIREVHLTYKVWVRRTEPLKSVPHDYLGLWEGMKYPVNLWLLFKADYVSFLYENLYSQ